MPHTGRTCHRKLASWLALLALAFPLFALPLWLLLPFLSRSATNTAQ
jgi:hypothetical protein